MNLKSTRMCMLRLKRLTLGKYSATVPGNSATDQITHET